MDSIKAKAKNKVIMSVLLFVIPFFFLLIVVVLIAELIIGSSNNNQSTNENAHIIEGTAQTGENLVFSVLCKNCEAGSEMSGIMGTEFMEKMSELINLYNNLEFEEQRSDELDYILLTTTIGYGKKMEAEIFEDSELFGTWLTEENLTNRDINSFPKESDITIDNAQKFYKWASVMMGTPYSLPNINLRGLSGNLITGKVITTCVEGNSTKTEEEELADLINQIIDVERNFSGETITDPSWWESILSIFGVKYSTNTDVLKDRLVEMFNNIDNPNSKYVDLLPFLGLDNYDPKLQCQNGYKREHTYTKFMNYEQYRVYLEKVFVPQTYINCDQCINRNSSDYNKEVLAKRMTQEIFDLAEYNRDYLGMTKIDYNNVVYGKQIDVGDLSYFTSPIKSACRVTSPYSELRGSAPHLAVDTTISSGNLSLYAVADGIVEDVKIYTTGNIGNTYDPNLGTCPNVNGKNLNSGIEIFIRHEINGKVYHSRYVHVDPNGIAVQKGDTVTKGQKIANMGNTGCSTGTHLHFELYTDEGHVNPTYLFNQCQGSEISGRIKIKTTDNFVTPEKCMVGNLTLDEVIAGMIKKDTSNAYSNPEFVKSLAVVIRTKLMNETNWCNEKINVSASVDIENNSQDLMLYGYVIDTQGMVLNYSGELLEDVDYGTFPCETLPVNSWNLGSNRAKVLNTLGIPDTPDLDHDYVVSRIKQYNKGCVDYEGSGGNVTVTFTTIPKEIKDEKDRFGNSYRATIQIPRSKITSTSRGVADKFSTVAARYYGTSMSYTDILHKFYASKTKLETDETVGLIDISTSPGLIDAKINDLDQLKYNSQSFIYGETLPGSDEIPTGTMSAAELSKINKHIIDYIDTAEQNAILAGDINPKRARVLAAAYWLIYNPFYKVQYRWGMPLEHGNYVGIGWDPTWGSLSRIECQNFVLWSLWNAGAKDVYPTWSILQHSPQFLNNGDEYFTVQQVLTAGIEIGDVLRRSRKGDQNGHWAIVWAVNYEECYVEVAHAVSEQEDTKISRYYCGDSFKYEHLYKLPDYYQDEAWKESVGK